jgi:beta-lactamase superfamily II metal-dependent hydrolase
MASKPTKINLYAYNVYFGDCFLLVFEYPGGGKRSVLIDFGSTGRGKASDDEADDANEAKPDTTGARLLKVAEHVTKACGETLDVVVATHRHRDHIYGFGLGQAGKLIRDLKPKLVVQPWTEDPKDTRDLTKKSAPADHQEFAKDPRQHFASTLFDMHSVAASAEAEALELSQRPRPAKEAARNLTDKIIFAARNNKIKNQAAVDSLALMGKAPSESHYVYYGYDGIDWEKFLPGVTVHVLGPPRLEDQPGITSTAKKSSEYWIQQAANSNFWSVQAATKPVAVGSAKSKPLFAQKYVINDRPPNVRWVIRQLRSVRESQLLEIVRFVDAALNNTSVILMFEVGDQKLLFPGDAQIENWSYALEKAKTNPRLKARLAGTTVYKVGHHGSRNANPISLWDSFEKKNETPKAPGRLKTVVSTIKGKHGESEDTEVPLRKMVDAMDKLSEFHSTERLTEIVELIEIPIA